MVGRFLKRLVNPETDQAADRPEAQESAPGDRSPVAEDTGDDHAVRLAANEEGLLQAVDAPAALSEDESREEEEVARPDTGPEPEPETEPGQMLESDAEDDLPEAEAEPETELAPEPEPEPEQVPESEVEEQVAPGQQPEPEDDLPEGEAEPEPQPELESESELESEPEPESEKPEPPTARQSPTDEFSMAQSAVSSGFIITLAHELRTPIASLRVSYDLLKHPDTLKDNPSQSKRLLGNIDRSIARLERQASDLLEVGYLRAGSMSLLKQPLDLTEPMLAAIDISRPAAALRHVAIELEIQPDQPSVVADGYRLTQVMTHLLSNAIKFEPVQGSVLVTLGTGSSATPSSAENLPNNEESAPDVVIARVVDHGPGIRESHFELIFEPFYRISDEGIEGGAGVGLGLAIVKGLIDLHEGTVWVKSTPGEVTEFGFSIPIA